MVGMVRADFSRALVVALLTVEALVAVRFTHARSKPIVEAKLPASAEQSASAATELLLPTAAAATSSSEPEIGAVSTDAQDTREARESQDSQDAPSMLRVLLVGNSYTMHHSLHLLLQRVAAAVEGGPQLVVDAVARGGFSLRNHLRKGEALQRIRARHYTHVVLQGHSLSALDHPEELVADAERFKQAIDAVAGRTVLYATWARSPEVSLYRTHRLVHSFSDMSTRVSSVYFDLSTRIGAGLAPVGSAFERSLVAHPRLTLWGVDGSHPSLAGSYMAACVLYGAITGLNPSQTTYVPPGLRPADAEWVRSVAAASLAASKTAAPAASAAGKSGTPETVDGAASANLRGPT